MIIIGLQCPKCGSSVLDNPALVNCIRCNAPYPESHLALIQEHSKAKMRLIDQKVEPLEAVSRLAEAALECVARTK